MDICQLNANEDSNASALLNTNPIFRNHAMNDSAFTYSSRIRLLQDVMREYSQIPKYRAACGQEIDKQGVHLRKCQLLQNAGLRQKLRNPICHVYLSSSCDPVYRLYTLRQYHVIYTVLYVRDFLPPQRCLTLSSCLLCATHSALLSSMLCMLACSSLILALSYSCFVCAG